MFHYIEPKILIIGNHKMIDQQPKTAINVFFRLKKGIFLVVFCLFFIINLHYIGGFLYDTHNKSVVLFYSYVLLRSKNI